MRYLKPVILFTVLSLAAPCVAGGETAGPIHHVVLVWLNDNVDADTRVELIERTRKLAGIETIRELHVGPARPSGRAIVDDSFDFGIHMTFDSREDMERYLKDERHTRYVEQHIAPLLEKLTVYDF